MKSLPFQVPAGCEAELSLMEETQRSISIGEKRLRHQNFSMSRQIAVRVLEDKRQGIFSTTHADENVSESFFKKARELARISPQDPHRRMAAPAKSYPIPLKADSKLFSRSVVDWADHLRELENRILSFDSRIKKVVRLELRESSTHSVLINSQGLHAETNKSSITFLAEVAAQEADQLEVAWDMRAHWFISDLKPEEMADEVAGHAVRSLGGKPILSGMIPVLFHPRVGVQILNLMGESLSAETVQQGRSFLKDLRKEKVASPVVSIIDDPLWAGGLSSTHVDDEGSPTQKVVLVENGVLKELLYDLRTASKEGRQTNGHGIKSQSGAPPRPFPTNLFIAPGSMTVEDLLASEPRVFYLWDVMGLHMADLITGEFSLGASGFLYEKGRMKQPVRGVTLAGRLLDLLGAVKEVGKDLSWYGDRGAPSFLVSQLMVGGT